MAVDEALQLKIGPENPLKAVAVRYVQSRLFGRSGIDLSGEPITQPFGFSVPLSELGKEDVSVALYLRWLQYLTILFLVGTIVWTAPATAYYTAGTNHFGTELNQLFPILERTMLGNLLNGSACSDMPDMCQPQPPRVDLHGLDVDAAFMNVLLSVLDIIFCAGAAISAFKFYHLQVKFARDVDRKTRTLGDYSLQVLCDVPDLSAEQLRRHFNTILHQYTADHNSALSAQNAVRRSEQPPHSASEAHEEYVSTVTLAYQDGDTIALMLKRRELLIQYSAVLAQLDRAESSSKPSTVSKVLTLQREQHQLLGMLHENSQQMGAKEQTRTIGAFVVFETTEAKQRALQLYHADRYRPTCLADRRLLLDGQFRLRVNAAPEPSSILWENLEHARSRITMLRRFGTALVMVVLLALAVAGVASVAAVQQHANRKLDSMRNVLKNGTCSRLGVQWDAPAWASANSSEGCLSRNSDAPLWQINQNDWQQREFQQRVPCSRYNSTLGCGHGRLELCLACFCSSLDDNFISFNRVTSGSHEAVVQQISFCWDYFEHRFAVLMLTALASLVITTISVLLSAAIRFMASFERHSNLSQAFSSVAIKTSAALLVNMGLITLLIHARIPSGSNPWKTDAESEPPQILPLIGSKSGLILAGEHQDFTSMWYATVGRTLIITMLLNAVVRPLIVCLTWIKWRVESILSAYSAKIQHQLNQALLAPEFDLASACGEALAVATVTLMFSSGIPLLLPIAALNFIARFMLDKATILWWFRRSPRTDASVFATMGKLFPYSVVLHLFVATWMLSALRSPSLTSEHLQAVVDTLESEALDLKARLLKWYRHTLRLMLPKIHASILIFILQVCHGSVAPCVRSAFVTDCGEGFAMSSSSLLPPCASGGASQQ
jgi:hypothetical protein